ncbi:MAG: hypothetical protein QOF77_984 [Solirubrobacteraceae bacterium]|nr:hypothetical protein [Solirubrobacteraceae bacterium]
MHAKAKALIGLAAAGTIAGVPAAWAASAPSTAAALARVSAAARPKGVSYVASVGEGAVSIVLSRDRRQVRGVLFAYRAPCSDGTHVRDFDVYNAVPVSASGRFKASYDTGPQTVSPGTTAQFSGSITGRVNKRGTKITGTVQSKGSLSGPTGSYACDTGLSAFSASD